MSARRKKHDEEHVDESWLLPYADMLTLLLALFIILFAMGQVDNTRYESLKSALNDALGGTSILEYSDSLEGDGTSPSDSAAAADESDDQDEDVQQTDSDGNGEDGPSEDLWQLQRELNRFIEEQGLSDRLSTEIGMEGLLITINDNILFDSGSDSLKSGAQDIVFEISDMLATDPPRYIQISGHTDDRPINTPQFQSNWTLSIARAENVLGFFLENDRLKPSQFVVAGHGEYKPIESNETEDGRQKNRRVEILILPFNVEREQLEAEYTD
ncbi:flagellar motor protein MotB [Alkalicoccobacillus murimartini]|uniref:Chemotaxis protein MotB n=1 Tax=Alkalicoccobacillus murimartini TaxID=171685 RepID=A0ABT9YDX2_9BACI|nr:flagellar motor protein MotB [Alkalicoccobacillus murimartini]MDQ0206048.1 chemotaxis protein MotB [Alkalicoccobacillus murimartini]